MIVVTGAAGFIGSQLVHKLNREGFNAIIAVDKFDREDKNKNLEGASHSGTGGPGAILRMARQHYEEIEFMLSPGCPDRYHRIRPGTALEA